MEQRQVVPVVSLVSQWHEHRWVRLPGAVSLFRCSFPFCEARAVCLGCQNRLDVVPVEQAGFSLHWCSQHL